MTGLTNGTGYTFTVHATNENGDSAESTASSSVTPITAPGTPTDVTATPADGSASVAFTAPASSAAAPVTGYTVTTSPGGQTTACTASPCTVSGLTNGETYTFTVTPPTRVGDSAESTASASVVPASVPGAPTDLSVTPGAGQAEVSFTGPDNDGGRAITGYTVTSSPGGHTATCAASPCTVTGLENGTAYTFTAHATNSIGDSAESSPSSSATPVTVPDAPADVSAVADDGSAEVSFTAPTGDGGSAVTGYTVTSSPGGKTATCTSSPCTVTGLDNGTAYSFAVHATNAVGDSSESTSSAEVTPVGDPAAVSSATFTPADGAIGVSFPVPADGGTPITRYEVTKDGGQTWGTLTTSETNGTVSGSITGLTNGQAYDVQVRAVNVHGTGTASSVESVTPIAVPGAPTQASAQRGAGSATVSFTAPVSDGGSEVTGYTVTSSPGGITGTCSTSPCTVSGLANGTSYTFTVHATNGHGNSAESQATSAVTPAAAPAAPGSVSVVAGDGSATVSFAPAASNGAEVTGYQYSIDNGTNWVTLPTSPVAGGRLSGSVPGLTNGTAYDVSVRAVNEIGTGTESAPQSVTPVAVVLSAIQTKYAALGGSSSFLGAPVAGEYTVAGGRAQNYQRGRIYWSQTTGAWSVHGSILDRYLALGGPSFLGFPTSDETATARNGRVNTFSGADGASIFWSSTTGARSVHGAIRTKYLALGGPSFLGFPTTNESATAARTGRYNHFSGADGASIFWSPASGAWSVHGAIRTQWITLGAERGRLGFPTSDEFASGSARRSTFASGTITWNGRSTVGYTRP